MAVKLIGLVTGFLFLLPIARAESCATLQACMEKFPAVATDGPGITPEERELAEAIQRFGAPAIPLLIKLLESDQKSLRTLAGYTLRDIDGLTPDHLAPLMKARKNGDGWIPPAIASIGTPEAIEFLVDDLRRDPETNTQVTWALESLGAKAAPGVARLLRCTRACEENVFNAAIFVLSEMKEQAAATVPSLLEIASDDKLAESSRQSAITAIGAIGKSSQPYVPRLVALKKQVPALRAAIDSALTGIGVSEAVPALLQNIASNPESTLRRIAALGRNGHAAGPAVIKYLDDPRWDTRIAAASALGRIGYASAEGALRKALANEDDWRFVFSAALALAHLKAAGSIDALKQVRDSHWYPPVRKLASSAIQHLESGSPLVVADGSQFAAIVGSPKTCDRVAEKTVPEPKDRKLYSRDHLQVLARLAYESAKRTYRPSKITEAHETNVAGRVDKIRQIPGVALKVPDGWLAGTDHGEWGGELLHMPSHGPRSVLFEANIQDIFSLKDQFVATSGLAHLGMNDGILLKIEKNASGGYRALPWKRLPAAPDKARLIEGNRLLIDTHDGGSVIVDTFGRLRMAKCL